MVAVQVGVGGIGEVLLPRLRFRLRTGARESGVSLAVNLELSSCWWLEFSDERKKSASLLQAVGCWVWNVDGIISTQG